MLLAALNKKWWRSLMKSEDVSNDSNRLADPASSEIPPEIEREPRLGSLAGDLPAADADGGRLVTDDLDALAAVNAGDELAGVISDEGQDGESVEAAGDDEADLEFEHDDPMGTAYDLERGTPLDEREARGGESGLPWRSKISSAKEFFNAEILYRFDIMENDDREALRGRYRLELKGYNGGIWTLEVQDEIDVVNRKEDAEIVFTMDHQDFLHVVNGNLNPQLAMLSKKMRVSGDMRKAVHFERLLAPVMD